MTPIHLSLRAGKPQRRVALRYRGGKARDAWWYIEFIDAVRGQVECYVEPYMGAASILLQLEPFDFEVINDLDGAVVNFFRVLREQPEALMRAISLTPYSRREYQLSRVPCPENPLEWARRTFVTSWQGFSRSIGNPGGWRFQTTRAGWDIHAPGQFADAAEGLAAIAQRLRGKRPVEIEEGLAVDIIQKYDREHTLFLVDPPYRFPRQSNKLYRHEMTDGDHQAMADVLHVCKGLVMLCGYPSALYDELFTRRGWRLETKASYGEAQKATVEGLWLNPAMQQALERSRAQGELELEGSP